MTTIKSFTPHQPLFVLIILLLTVSALPQRLDAKEPSRLFEPLANTPNITLIYISEAALQSGIRLPSTSSSISFSLKESKITSFEMAKAQFDGKEKKAIIRLGNEILSRNKFKLLTEIQESFDGAFTRIYYIPDSDNAQYASQVFIFSSSNSFGATLISMTGRLNLRDLFSGRTPTVNQLSLTDLFYWPANAII